MPRVCWCVAITVASLAANPAAVAHADEPDGKALFAQARELRLHGECTKALPLFRRAYEVFPAGLGSLRNVAECEEALGHFLAARRAWLDLRRELLVNSESKYEGWAEDASQAADRLASKLAMLTIDVQAVTASGSPAMAPRLDVSVNGESLSPDLLGKPSERDPGHYLVRAVGSAPGIADEQSVDLAAADAKRVVLHVVMPPADDVETPARISPLRTVAWVAAGIGAASFVGAGIAGIERQSAMDDLTTECGSTATCPRAQNEAAESAKVRGIEERGHAAATWVNALVVVGALGLSTGVVLYTIGNANSREALLLSPAGVSAVGSY
jgi:hypothetical protein